MNSFNEKPKRNAQDRWILVSIAIAILLVAGLLRFYRLGTQSLWLDEVFTFRRASLSFASLMAGKNGPSAMHPPLYFLLTHFAIGIAPTDFALRFPAALFGIISVPAIGLVGSRLFNKQTGVIAAILLTLSPVAIHYSQEARSYSGLTFSSLLSAFIFWKAIESHALRWWVALLLVNVLGLYSNYLQLLIVIAQLLFLALWLVSQLSAEGRKALFYFAGTLVGLGLFIQVAKLDVLGSVSELGSKVTSSGSDTILVQAWPAAKQAFDWIHLYDNLFIKLFFILFVIIGGISDFFNKKVMPTLFLLLLMVVPISLILISNPSDTAIYPRYFIIALPFYLILVSKGIVVISSLVLSSFQRQANRPVAAAAALLWVAIMGLILYPHISALKQYYNAVPGYSRDKPRLKEAVSYLEQNWRPGELIMTANKNTHYIFSRYMPVFNLNSLDSLTKLISEKRSGYFIVDSWGLNNEWTKPDTIQGLEVVTRFPQIVIYGFNRSLTELGEPIEIKLASSERQMFIREGWSPLFHQEGDKVYGRTQGNMAAFEVILLADQAYTMQFTAKGLIGSKTMSFKVNGNVMGESIIVTSDEWATYRISLPASALRSGLNRIEMWHASLEDQTQPTLIGDSGVNVPVPIAVDVRHSDYGNYAIIYVDGVAHSYFLAGRGYGRGYTVLALSKEGQVLEWEAFDTCCLEKDANSEAKGSESHRMSEFINRLPAGTIVVMATKDDASSALTEEAVNAIKSVGGVVDLRGKFRWMHGLVGVKGAAPGTAKEVLDEREVTIVLGKDARKEILLFNTIELVREAVSQ